ncbi:site-specific integrase [Kiritimatiellaeota bacterium B1221]|nr:site-specific integrase [Kiritimatiellaeota bacterium B1221]
MTTTLFWGYYTVKGCKEWIDSELAQRTKVGTLASSLSGSQTTDAVDAFHRLKNAGHKVSLCTIVDFYLQHNLAPDEKIVTVKEVLACYEAEMKAPSDGNLPARPESINSKKKRVRSFIELYGEKDIREVTESDVKTWSDSFAHLAPRTQLNKKAELQSVINFAESFVPEFKNTVCHIKQTRRKESKPACILSPKDTEAMMRYLEENYSSSYVVTFALMAFAGIRPWELTRPDNPLTWENIRLDAKKVFIEPRQSKTRTWREVPICDNLMAWLKPHQGSGRIAPSVTSFTVARAKAMRKTTTLEKWPVDALRHSYGTYGGEIHGLHKVAGFMGHTGGIGVFQSHYRGRCTPQNAEAYFQIMPNGKKGVVINMKSA